MVRQVESVQEGSHIHKIYERGVGPSLKSTFRV